MLFKCFAEATETANQLHIQLKGYGKACSIIAKGTGEKAATAYEQSEF